MKRLHVHLSVDDLDDALKFYRALFGIEPVRSEDGTATWLLAEPALSFVISRRMGGEAALLRLGLPVADAAAMDAMRARFGRATPAAGAGEGLGASELHLDPVDVLWEVHTDSEPRLAANPNRAVHIQARQDREKRQAADWAYSWRSAARRRRGGYSPRPFGSIG